MMEVSEGICWLLFLNARFLLLRWVEGPSSLEIFRVYKTTQISTYCISAFFLPFVGLIGKEGGISDLLWRWDHQFWRQLASPVRRGRQLMGQKRILKYKVELLLL